MKTTMKIIRGVHNLTSVSHGCVATIGNFDGVHLGHQQIFAHLKKQATQLALPSLVITFEPHPFEFFQSSAAPSRLTCFREKMTLFAKQGIHRVLCIPFNAAFANLTAALFIEQILVKKLGVKWLVVGDDFRFGKKRQGDFHMLSQAGMKYHFRVEDTPTLMRRHERVSSTRVRYALAHHDLALATTLLGHPYFIIGRIVHGDKRGRLLGFPTANIPLSRKTCAIRGVFAVTITGIDHQTYQGVANIGKRPTLGDGQKMIIEVHLFHFNREIYGQSIQVNFLKQIRQEKQFTSLEQLQAQICHDIDIAKDFFDTDIEK